MKHSFNYTGRKTLTHRGKNSELAFVLYADEVQDKYEFSAFLDLSDRQDLNPDFQVIIEAKYHTSYERYKWGTVQNCNGPDYRQPISSIKTDAVEFTVKVTDYEGKVLAHARKISPEIVYSHINDNNEEDEEADTNEAESSSLLAIRAIDMSQLWRVELREHYRPLLFVNKQHRIKERLFDSPELRAAIFPAALREIALRYLAMEGASSRNRWANTFFRFAQSCNEDPIPEKYDDTLYEERVHQWIENFVEAYCDKMKLLDALLDEEAA